MSKWLIDGVRAGLIMGPPILSNGRCMVDFDRKDATLEQIEKINWAKPAIQYLGDCANEQGLPEGYGFDVEDIEYMHSCKAHRVYLKVASRFLGDVTGYQRQITELENAAAKKDSTISSQASAIQEQERQIESQTATIQE